MQNTSYLLDFFLLNPHNSVQPQFMLLMQRMLLLLVPVLKQNL